jgi:SAM-dependent methyltransferase
MDGETRNSLKKLARFFDARQVGDVGPLGFRRSTNLTTLFVCAERLVEKGLITLNRSAFLDLGCADGRVNLFFSYLARYSVGVELDEWTLDEYEPLKQDLEESLKDTGMRLPNENVYLFQGDATDDAVHGRISNETGLHLADFDLFYTYLIMHEEFAEMLAEKAKKGAVFMVYGLHKIMPRYPGFRLMEELSPMEGVLALYEKG